MNQKITSILLFVILAAFSAQGQQQQQKRVYDARTADWQILTPVPPEEPRINGPKVYGARPGKQFVFRIPCQGIRPIQFRAEGMPPGLLLDATTGIITGRTPDKEDVYRMILTATNKKGTMSREFSLVVGEKLALTPPMGWNSWGGYMRLVSDQIMRRAADFIVSNGLADVGFQYVSIDDCWMRIDPDFYETRKEMFASRSPGYDYSKVVGPTRDECGRVLSNDFFPDMKAMTDYIHSLGLKTGIYSGPGPQTCQNFVSSFGYEEQDARQYADWGFDLLKYDMCSYRDIIASLNKALPEGSDPVSEITLWYPMTEFLAKQDRDIFYNLCQYGRQNPWEWAPKLNIQSWRIGGDLNHDVFNYFKESMRIVKELRDYSKPGQWNDPDFMYIGKIHTQKNLTAPPEEIPLNSNQRYQYVSLFALISAPFFFSANIDEPNDFMVSLLRNSDIVNINQDELGHVAEIIRETDKQVILMKKLADGSAAIGIFNTDPESEQIIDLTWKETGRNVEQSVRDLWRQKDLGKMKDGISVNISANGCAVFKIN